MATGKGKRNTTTIDATKHQAATTTQQKAQNTSATKNTVPNKAVAQQTINTSTAATKAQNTSPTINTTAHQPVATTTTPQKVQNSTPISSTAYQPATTTTTTTPAKANVLTSQTAIKNNVSNAAAAARAKALNTFASKNKFSNAAPRPKAVNTSASKNVSPNVSPTTASQNVIKSTIAGKAAPAGATTTAPYTSPNYSTPVGSTLRNPDIGVTPTTSAGADAFPSLQDALEAAAAAAGVAGGVNVQELNNAINPNSTPQQKTDIWGRVIDNLLDSADMLAGSNTNVQQSILRRNAAANNGYTDEENLTMGKGNPAAGNTLYDALSNAAADALAAYGLTAGNGTTPGTLSQQILDPERYGSLPNPGTAESDALLNAIINASGGGSRSGGTSKGRYTGASGASGLTGLAGGLGEYDLNSLMDLINTRLAEYDNGYNTLMEYLLNAYNANYSSLNDAYMAALNQLGLNYNDTESLLNDRLANSRQELEDARTRALQEAYIQRMLEEKNLADRLGAYGLSGGATESVMANLLNNYRNNRNAVETNTQNSLRDLLQTYLENINTARQNYNKGLLDAENNRLSAAQNLANNLYSSQANAASQYTNQRANTYEDLYNTLANIYAAQAKAALK